MSPRIGRSRLALAGTAVFSLDGQPANLSYVVSCDSAWKTRFGRISGEIGDREVEHIVVREDGLWHLDREPATGLDHLDDLDFSFTPATNLLQIKRIDLPLGRIVRSPAAWLDLETGALTELEQIYERRNTLALYYRAPDVGYEGLLELAPNGSIQLYPGLWQAELNAPNLAKRSISNDHGSTRRVCLNLYTG